jgi:muconolactone delta-isomerase
MAVYMVDRDLPGISMEELGAAQRRAIDWSQRYQSEGRQVRYIRSTFVPGEAHCMCLFEAPDADLVAELNDDAEIPYTRVTEALDLTPTE